MLVRKLHGSYKIKVRTTHFNPRVQIAGYSALVEGGIWNRKKITRERTVGIWFRTKDTYEKIVVLSQKKLFTDISRSLGSKFKITERNFVQCYHFGTVQ